MRNVISIYLIPILRTSPIETSSSIACHVVSNEIVVSMSRTPSSPRALEVVPTPVGNQNAHIQLATYEIFLNTKISRDQEFTSMSGSYWEVNKIEIEII